jgi:hypothetical protein
MRDSDRDAGLEHALAFSGRVVAGVLAQVALFAGLLDGLNDLGTLLLEAFDFLFHLLAAFNRNGNALHGSVPALAVDSKKTDGEATSERPQIGPILSRSSSG